MGEIQDDEPPSDDQPEDVIYEISVVSSVIKPLGYIRRMRFSFKDVDIMHWCVMENCIEAKEFIARHEDDYVAAHPYAENYARIEDFNTHFLDEMIALQEDGSDAYSRELHILAYKPQFHSCYTHCNVNGIKFVVWDKDQHLKTQNSGVMVEAGDARYYGLLQNIIELKYAEGMPVVILKCEWYNTDPAEGNTKMDHRLLSIDTSNTWFEDAPYCLAKHAQQVFYLEDPKLGDSWKVVNEVYQRGTYSDTCLAVDKDISQVVVDAYQEEVTYVIPPYVSNEDNGYDDEVERRLYQSTPLPFDDHFQPELDRLDEDEEYVSEGDEEEEDDEDGGEYLTDEAEDELDPYCIADE